MPLPVRVRRRASSLLPRVSRGWLTLLLAATFLVSTATERAHQAEVLHAVCGEHGELIHVTASPAVLADLACPSPCDEEPTAQRQERGGEAHDHCRLGPLQREQDPPPPAAHDLACAAPPATLGVAPPSIDPPRAEPLLLLAPKQSPPV